jgi:diketogulonate reductase-like aldo/keto reductase
VTNPPLVDAGCVILVGFAHVQDLYLIHWPVKFENEVLPAGRQPDGRPSPLLKASIEFNDTWKALYAVLHPRISSSGDIRC